MIWINIDDIQKDFTHYLQRVEQGETLLILRNNQPIIEIKPTQQQPANLRPIGLCAGEFVVPDSFHDPLPNHILAGFLGE